MLAVPTDCTKKIIALFLQKFNIFFALFEFFERISFIKSPCVYYYANKSVRCLLNGTGPIAIFQVTACLTFRRIRSSSLAACILMLFNAALFFLLVLAIVVFLRICYAGPFDLATLLCSEIF